MPMSSNSKKLEFQLLLGQRVKTIRLQKKLSLRKLAQRCDLDYSDIGKYEKGEINLQLSTIFQLAYGLQLHPKELFDFDFEWKHEDFE